MFTLFRLQTDNALHWLINSRHLNRLTTMLAEARSSGATVVDLESTPINTVTRQMPLTLILNPSKDLAISKEEIFGPILPVFGYDTVEDVVAEVNRGERPLGLCELLFCHFESLLIVPFLDVYGTDEALISYVIDNTKSGGVSVNAAAIQAALPGAFILYPFIPTLRECGTLTPRRK